MINVENINSSLLCKALDFDHQDILVNISKVVRHPIHFHKYLEIVLVIKGAIDLKSCFKKFTLKENDFAILNPYEIHSIQSLDEDTVIAYLHFNDSIYSIFESTLLWDPDVLKKDVETYEKVRENIIRIIRLADHDNKVSPHAISFAKNISTMLKNNFKHTLYTFEGEKNIYEPDSINFKRLNSINDYLYSRYDEKLTLDDMAEHLNVNKYYLAHFMKEGLGTSFKGLLNLIRVDRSELSILEGKIPIGEIGYKVGFSSPQYFTKYFKLYFGMSPSEYRKMYGRQTIQFREFDEEICSLPPDTLMASHITVNLKDSDYHLSVIKDNNGNISADSLSENITANELYLDFDCDEMIIIIKRK